LFGRKFVAASTWQPRAIDRRITGRANGELRRRSKRSKGEQLLERAATIRCFYWCRLQESNPRPTDYK
jgi:hypothetical protein